MQGQSPEETRRGVGWGWIAVAAAVCAFFWSGLYFASLQPWQEQLGRLRTAQAAAEAELPTPQAEQELARVGQELADLNQRWERTSITALAQQLEAHSVTLLSAQPGEEAGTFHLEVEGSAHGLGQVLPAWEKPSAPGRLPAVLYLRRIKRDPRLRGRFRLDGAGRITDWRVAAPAAKE